MGKKIINTTLDKNTPAKLTQSDASKLGKVAEKIIFHPTDVQARVKAQFWTRFQPGPLADPNNISMANALEVTGATPLRKWWSLPGFLEWFMNREEEKERLKYLFNRGLDSVEEILADPTANANAKANIFKMLAEMNGYLGKKQADRFADDEINNMSEQQLKSFLVRKGVKLVEEKVVDVTPDKEADGETET